MRLNLILKAAFLLGLFVHLQASAEGNSVRYKNQRGSVLELIKQSGAVAGTGNLTGSFITAVGDCKADMNVPVPVTGYYNGNALALSINFPHCKQVVTMTGNLSTDENSLNTLWLDAKQAVDPVRANWNSNVIGADSFDRVSQ